MNIGELKKIVSDGESDRLEFKSSTGQRTQAGQYVAMYDDHLKSQTQAHFNSA
jgi:hypothetical protein